MRRGIWILAAMALAGVAFLMMGSRTLISTVGGVEEARELEQAFSVSLGGVLAPQPPVRVRRMPLGEGRGWMWLVDVALAPGVPPDDVRVQSHLPRLVARSLGRTVAGVRSAGVRIRLSAAGRPPADLRYDAAGRLERPPPVEPAAVPAPPRPAPAPTPPGPPAPAGTDPAGGTKEAPR